jgi:hypothetical protein
MAAISSPVGDTKMGMMRICLWATRLTAGGYGVPDCSSRGRALPKGFDVSTLISRGLERKSKKMRKILNMNGLRITMQVIDFKAVGNKKADFASISHP